MSSTSVTDADADLPQVPVDVIDEVTIQLDQDKVQDDTNIKKRTAVFKRLTDGPVPGLGLKISSVEHVRGVVIEEIIEGGAAFLTGNMKVGDIIININGRPALDLSHLEVTEELRASEVVTLEVAHPDEHDPHQRTFGPFGDMKNESINALLVQEAVPEDVVRKQMNIFRDNYNNNNMVGALEIFVDDCEVSVKYGDVEEPITLEGTGELETFLEQFRDGGATNIEFEIHELDHEQHAGAMTFDSGSGTLFASWCSVDDGWKLYCVEFELSIPSPTETHDMLKHISDNVPLANTPPHTNSTDANQQQGQQQQQQQQQTPVVVPLSNGDDVAPVSSRSKTYLDIVSTPVIEPPTPSQVSQTPTTTTTTTTTVVPPADAIHVTINKNSSGSYGLRFSSEGDATTTFIHTVDEDRDPDIKQGDRIIAIESQDTTNLSGDAFIEVVKSTTSLNLVLQRPPPSYQQLQQQQQHHLQQQTPTPAPTTATKKKKKKRFVCC